jgi:hypothetical protein
MFPSPYVWIDSYFVDVMSQQGFARCLQDFANDPRIADVFAMFAKMFAWFRIFDPKKLGRRFLCRYSHHTAARMFAKMFYNFANVQKCWQICKSVQKCLQKIFFLWGGKNNFYLVG